MRLVRAAGLSCAVLGCVAVLAVSACTTNGTTESSSSSGGETGGSSGASGASNSGSGGSSGTTSGGSGGAGSSSSSGSSGRIIRVPDSGSPVNQDRDSDCDGLTDAQEFGRTYAGGARTSPSNPDSDGDGILDGVELGQTTIVAGDATACGPYTGDVDPLSTTNPTQADTDGDGIPDGLEDHNRNGRVDAGETDPSGTDSDGDGLTDGAEDTNRDGVRQPTETSASSRDTDEDGIPDGIEDVNRDGTRQPTETDPRNPDTDNDGLRDGDEDKNWNHVVDAGETNPLVPDLDTDMDGIPDFRESQLGFDPNDPDMDDDGLNDGVEDANRDGVVNAGETNPRRSDSDCDGIKDGDEDANHNGIRDTGETDPLARDTDGDLLADGLERGVTVNPDPVNCTMFTPDANQATTTNPTAADSDQDGINDGIEDKNRNGAVDAGETNPNNRDTDGDGRSDGEEDLNRNGRVDLGETDPLTQDQDTDGDGITDPKEAMLGTNPNSRDSDGDGIEDGVEDANRDGVISVTETHPLWLDTDCDGVGDGEEDANHNGTREPTETDPRNPDTDNDGLTDGLELGRTTTPDATRCTSFTPAAQPPANTNPLNPDSDGDGVPDGTEDGNRNGRFDPGEFNPNDPLDTMGVVQQACAIQNLTPITFHNTANPPDIQLATRLGFAPTPITVANAPVGFYLTGNTDGPPMVAFAVMRAPAGNEPTASAVADTTRLALASVGAGLGNAITQALPCTNPPNDCTWDGFEAVLGTYDLNFNGDASQAATAVVERILPGATDLMANVGATGPFKLRMQFVRRSAQRVIIVGALMGVGAYNPDTTAFYLEDITNGSALAQVGDETAVKCDTFTTQAYPKADIMVVIDNSGSMGSSQTALSNAANAITTQLATALLDWRVARITSDTHDPHNPCAGAVCNPTARRYGEGAGTSTSAFEVWPFIRPVDGTPAALQAASDIIRQRLMVPGTTGWGVESTFSPLRFILKDNPDLTNTRRLLPATAAGAAVDEWKLRADARFAVLIVTDASEQSSRTGGGINVIYNWTDGANGTVQQFLRGGASAESWDPNRTDEAPIFMGGILCPLGQWCNGEDEASGNTLAGTQRYHDSINALGGIIGNIANTGSISAMVGAYMTALIGNTSPYLLTQAPISASIKVAVDGQPVTGCNWANVPRSRQNGFDYDGATRKITFYGTCRPSNEVALLGKKIAVSYRYWVDRTAPNGNPTPCGGMCVAPLQCNPATNMCECPSNCGLANGCAAPSTCDTATNVCACACPADCGGTPSDPRFVCNQTSCQFECPADCGGVAPGPQFTCNRTTCQYQCAACNPATRPQVNGDRFSCDLTTCQWSCPSDCGSVAPGDGYRCNPQTCAYECTADCGGSCSGFETCNPSTCGCMCVQNATCGAGLRFDMTACDCVCDSASLNCPASTTPNTTACTCECQPDCGGACVAPEICIPSTCECYVPGG
jgi:hypothetical protein